MHCINNTKKIILDPAALTVQQSPLLAKSDLDTLKRHNIKIAIDTYDSDENFANKPVILFIHGNSTSKTIFKKQYRHFSSKFRVISFDMLGHGKSTKLIHEDQLPYDILATLARFFYSLEGLTAVAIQFLKLKQIEQANILGWSLGGHVAFSMASSHPELINSIVTIGTPPINFNNQGIKQGFNKWFANTIIPHWITNPQPLSMQNAIEISEHLGIKNQDEALINDLVSTDPLLRKHLFTEIDNDFFSFSHYKNAEYFVKSTNIPLCLLVGEHDAGINVKYIESFNGSLKHPASEISVIRDAPHAAFLTHEHDCHSIIDNFFQRITCDP